MNKTSIEWCDKSANPIRALNTKSGKIGWFCVHKSPGCKHCYSERWNGFRGNGLTFTAPNLTNVIWRLEEKVLWKLIRSPKRERVFLCDMTDLFLPEIPQGFRDTVFAACALAPQKTVQILTKRAAEMAEYFADPDTYQRILQAAGQTFRAKLPRLAEIGVSRPPARNVWLGVSVEDQERADERIPELLRCPAAVRFLSCEPLLGPLNLRCVASKDNGLPTGHADYRCSWLDALAGVQYHEDQNGEVDVETHRIDQVIGGGESGPGARPCHPAWARALRDDCRDTETAFFWKQWGAWAPDTAELEAGYPGHDNTLVPLDPAAYKRGRLTDAEMETAARVRRLGKKLAGRLLDGVEHNGMPEPTHV